MGNWRHWHKPDFWRWWWTTGAREETKAVVFTGAALALGIVGYLSATGMADDEKVAFTEQVVTVTRTTLVKGKPRVVREVITTRLPAETHVRTIRRNGRTITVAAAGETITRTTTTTIAGPVQRSVVTKNRMVTVPRDRLVRVTLPGVSQPGTTVERVVTAPGETQTQTVTGATRTVTAPAQTVTNTRTVTGPTTTITGPTTTVTGPTTTVTGPTQTVTDTETVTVTVTEPQP